MLVHKKKKKKKKINKNAINIFLNCLSLVHYTVFISTKLNKNRNLSCEYCPNKRTQLATFNEAFKLSVRLKDR